MFYIFISQNSKFLLLLSFHKGGGTNRPPTADSRCITGRRGNACIRCSSQRRKDINEYPQSSICRGRVGRVGVDPKDTWPMYKHPTTALERQIINNPRLRHGSAAVWGGGVMRSRITCLEDAR